MAEVFDKTLRDCKTPEEAAELIKKRRAAINRTIHFGPLRRIYHRQNKELAAAKSELAKYQESTPTTGGRRSNSPSQPTSFKTGLRSAFQKYAAR